MRPSAKRLALLDAEAVLLVDDRDRRRSRGRPPPGSARACRRGSTRPPAASRARLPTELVSRPHGDAELAAELLDREEVLLGERLGRRHQRALVAALDRAQERVERDDRLAGADVALEQPLHRRRAGEVAVDLRDRLLLVLGQRERKRRAVALDQLARLAERRRDLLLALARAAGEPELEHEQLVEREPPPPRLRLLERPRPVQRVERVGAPRQPLALLQPGRQRVGLVRDELERAVGERAHPRRRDLLAGRIDRREVGGRGRRRSGRTS